MTHLTEMPVRTAQACHFKSGLYTLTSLQIVYYDIIAIQNSLDEKIKQAPKFFCDLPLIIDLSKLQRPEQAIPWSELKSLLLQRQLFAIGIRGGQPHHHESAKQAGLAVLSESSLRQQDHNKLPDTPLPSRIYHATKVITQPVRSGQQIYAEQADLIVLAPVSHGAELMADGHIHVYAPLRGRALAGLQGDEEARIFCQSLEAELVAIAGHYWAHEELKKHVWQQPAMIGWSQGRLQIQALYDKK